MNDSKAPASAMGRPPPREIFFAPLQVALEPNDLERVNFAYICSKYGHARQLRDDGRRYFDHPKGAAWICIDEFHCRDPEILIDILLHDMEEDQYLLSPYRIAMNFGEERALDISALTKLPPGKESADSYLERVIARGPMVVAAKLFDRLHNNRSLGACTPEKQARQVHETKNLYLPKLIPALGRDKGTWGACAKKLEEKILTALAPYAA